MKIRQTDVYLRYNIPVEVTVLVDSREKRPMLFPSTIRISHPERMYMAIPIAVNTQVTKLDFGDYTIKGHENLCTIERKASALEIYKNLNESHDRIRQAKAFRKLVSGCHHPYLLIEASPAELLRETSLNKTPQITCHRLSLVLAKYGFHALFIPWKSKSVDTRRKIGTLMVHIMLGYILGDTFDAFPPQLLEDE